MSDVCRIDHMLEYITPLVLKVCSADPKLSASSSQGIRGYTSVIAALKFTYFCKLKK
jgi:hypothetical protein